MTNKIEKLKWIYKEEGLLAVISHGFHVFFTKIGLYRDYWILGRLVELTGNIGRLDGCRFRLDNPLIKTKVKSSFFQGTYEKDERRIIRRFLDPSLPVIELGASIGVVSCITNKKLKNPKDHIVVEANPELIPLLEANRDFNNCSFEIINKASGYGSKEVTFYLSEKFLSGSIERVTSKPIVARTITLSDIFTARGFKYANLICDIEGGELDLITEEIKLLSEKIFQIILEVHPSRLGEDTITKLLKQLTDAGFQKMRTGSYSTVLLLENNRLRLPKESVA